MRFEVDAVGAVRLGTEPERPVIRLSSGRHVTVGRKWNETGRSGFEKRCRPGLPRLAASRPHRRKDDEMATTKGTTTQGGDTASWTADERAAMKEHAAEIKRAGGKGAAKAAAEAQACLDKIAEMPDGDRAIAERVHAIVTQTAPDLTVKTWYGMPAYARDGKVLCFFQPGDKFGAR